MQNQNTPPPPEESEPTQNFALTQDDQIMIIFALGGLTTSFLLDENRKMSSMAKRCLKLAKKFGIQ